MQSLVVVIDGDAILLKDSRLNNNHAWINKMQGWVSTENLEQLNCSDGGGFEWLNNGGESFELLSQGGR